MAQRIRAAPVLIPPTLDNVDNTVETNLAAIIEIRRWYEALEFQAMLQLGLNLFNMMDDREKLEERIFVQIYGDMPKDA